MSTSSATSGCFEGYIGTVPARIDDHNRVDPFSSTHKLIVILNYYFFTTSISFVDLLYMLLLSALLIPPPRYAWGFGLVNT
jgi:hypothetical protein